MTSDDQREASIPSDDEVEVGEATREQLDEEQSLLVSSLMAMTSCDAQQAAFLLEAAGNDLVMAAQLFQDEQQLRERANRPRQTPQSLATVGTREVLVQRPLPLPFSLIGLPFHIAFRVIRWAFSLTAVASRRILPGPVHRALCRFFRMLAPRPRPEDPVAAAAEFIAGFSAKYGERTIKWELSGWEAAAQKSQRDGVFLFIYLHSERHHETEAFCRNTLCSPPFLDYVNATFSSWGGDIRNPEAYRLATRLGVSSYPYCGLLAFSGARTRLITFSEGIVRPERLAELLQTALTEHGGILWEERLLREQRENDRRLREEQDADYERSLEADRIKAQEKQAREEEAARQRALERQQLEEEEALQREAELAREKEAEALQNRRREKKLMLADEAVETAARDTGVIRIRFPGGETEQRRFYMSDEYERVVDWVESLDCNPYVSFSLSTTFPRRVLGPEDHRLTLTELQFDRQTALVIVEASED
jgi:FAS-associated factor 2